MRTTQKGEMAKDEYPMIDRSMFQRFHPLAGDSNSNGNVERNKGVEGSGVMHRSHLFFSLSLSYGSWNAVEGITISLDQPTTK